jgi:hypothetical protein
VSAVGQCFPVQGLNSGGDGSVGDEAGGSAVGVGQAVAPVGPAHQLLPAFVVGEGMLDGDAVGGVPVAVAFSLLDSAGQCSRPRFLGGVIACPQWSRLRPR